MAHRFAICLAMISFLFVAPQPAAAAFTHTFDTIDAIDTVDGYSTKLSLTGVLAGQPTPTTVIFYMYGDAVTQRCERFALLLMAKPGKYRLLIGGGSSTAECKLVVRAP